VGGVERVLVGKKRRGDGGKINDIFFFNVFWNLLGYDFGTVWKKFLNAPLGHSFHIF